MKKTKPNLTKAALPIMFLITVLLFGFLQSCVDQQDCDRDNPEVKVDSLQDNYDGRFPYKPSWTELEYIYEDDSTEAEVLTFQLYQRDTLDHDYNGWDGGGVDCTTYKDEVDRYYYKAADSYDREHHFIIEREIGEVDHSIHIDRVDLGGTWFFATGRISWFEIGSSGHEGVKEINGITYRNVYSRVVLNATKEDTNYHRTFTYSTQYGLIQDIDHVRNRIYSLNKLP